MTNIQLVTLKQSLKKTLTEVFKSTKKPGKSAGPDIVLPEVATFTNCTCSQTRRSFLLTLFDLFWSTKYRPPGPDFVTKYKYYNYFRKG